MLHNIFTTNNILVSLATIFTFWVLQNKGLRDGVTEWFINKKLKKRNSIKDHNVLISLEQIKYKLNRVQFEEKLKTELFIFYTTIFIDNMEEFVKSILTQYKNLSLVELKKTITLEMLKTLKDIDSKIEDTIQMPDELQHQFNTFSNYLSIHHTEEIENVLSIANNKDVLVDLIFNTVASNSSWCLFYTTAMFERFNGKFKKLSKEDIFK